jgi:AraC-like DNA-binding protein
MRAGNSGKGSHNFKVRKNLAERQAQMRERAARESVTEKHPVRSARVSETFETPYTVGEVAKMTGFSVQTVIRIFTQERGVLIYEPKRTRKRASYRSIRIPRYVYRRVMQSLTA